MKKTPRGEIMGMTEHEARSAREDGIAQAEAALRERA